jgi:hypothetical protein
METLDTLNRRYKRDTVAIASGGTIESRSAGNACRSATLQAGAVDTSLWRAKELAEEIRRAISSSPSGNVVNPINRY